MTSANSADLRDSVFKAWSVSSVTSQQTKHPLAPWQSRSTIRLPSQEAPVTSTNGPIQVRGACGHDCPDTCGWVVEVRDGTAERLAGDPTHPFNRGTLCA